jgi:hypothetical protein
MGKIESGAFSSVSGKVGNLVGATWKKVNYLKAKPKRSSKPPTQQQEEQRLRFRMVTKFVSLMTPLLRITNKRRASESTANNVSFREIIHHNLTGAYPNFEIDIPSCIITKGVLVNGGSPSVQPKAGGILEFNWNDNSGNLLAKPGDQAILIVYCPELPAADFRTEAGARNAGTASMNASAFTGKLVHTWISFMDKTTGEVATSEYTGQHTVL